MPLQGKNIVVTGKSTMEMQETACRGGMTSIQRNALFIENGKAQFYTTPIYYLDKNALLVRQNLPPIPRLKG